MNKFDRLEALFSEHGITLSGSLIEDASESGAIYAFVNIRSYGNKKNAPSQRKIGKISATARELGYNVTFVFSGSGKQDASEILELWIRQKYSPRFEVAVTAGGGAPEGLIVWLAANDALSDRQENEIKESIGTFSQALDVKLRDVKFLSPGKRSTQMGLMLALRTISPCSIDQLLSVLQAKYIATDIKWLKQNLDGLRKKRLVVRDANGMYFLSLHGLDSLGTHKGRGSPDARRALALARQPSKV